MSEVDNEPKPKDHTKIVAIVVAGIIILACIIASSAVTIAFLTNAPWS